MGRGRGIGIVGVVAMLALSGCGSSKRTGSPRASASPTAVVEAPTPTVGPTTTTKPPVTTGDWVTFGGDNARTGVVSGFPKITKPYVAWRVVLDGAVYGQPLVIGKRVYAGTENDTVYALDAGTGAVVWSKHLGTPVPKSALPCGNIDPLGITGTMAYDKATGLIFAVAETTGGEHTLYGLNITTGAVTRQRNVDPPKGDRIAHQQRSALTVLDGRVYVAYGGLAGDCAAYIGSVIGAPTSGSAANLSYAIPTTREAGIWAPGGAVVTPEGHLLYAAGNGESTTGYDGSDSVISLDPATLKLVDSFSPDTWADDNAADLDLGSMTPAVVGSYVYADGKRGTGYVLRAGHLGGIGGDIAQANVCKAFGAAAVSGSTLYVPCADGTRAVQIGTDGTPFVQWHTSAPTNGSPILAGGSVWTIDWNAGVLYLLNPANGVARTHIDLGPTPHFATPTLSRGAVYVGTLAGVTALR